MYTNKLLWAFGFYRCEQRFLWPKRSCHVHNRRIFHKVQITFMRFSLAPRSTRSAHTFTPAKAKCTSRSQNFLRLCVANVRQVCQIASSKYADYCVARALYVHAQYLCLLSCRKLIAPQPAAFFACLFNLCPISCSRAINSCFVRLPWPHQAPRRPNFSSGCLIHAPTFLLSHVAYRN